MYLRAYLVDQPGLMRILVFEDNLLWGPRLRKTIEALGHEPMLLMKPTAELPEADVAVVNLGAVSLDPATLIPRLKAAGLHVVGHAGHKEADLLDLGRRAGCDQVLTNGQTTFGLERALALVVLPD